MVYLRLVDWGKLIVGVVMLILLIWMFKKEIKDFFKKLIHGGIHEDGMELSDDESILDK
jgi:hypothetical protein